MVKIEESLPRNLINTNCKDGSKMGGPQSIPAELPQKEKCFCHLHPHTGGTEFGLR